MSKYKWPIIAGVVLIAGAVYVLWNPPSTKDALNYWRGEYNELRKITTADEQIKLATIAELNENIALLQGSNDSAYGIIAQKEAEKEAAEEALKKGRQGWEAFSVEAQAKLAELDKAWADKFDILLMQDQEKDKIIFSLTQQYLSALSIGDNYKALWEGERSLRTKCEQGLSLSDKRIQSLSRQVKTTKFVALAVVLAVVLLKK